MANTTGKKPKNSGRKKGTPNKRTFDAIALAEEIGVNPLEVMLRRAKGDWKWFGYKEKSLKIGKAVVRDHISVDDRHEAARDAAQYLYGKRRYVDEEGNTGMDDLRDILDEIDGSSEIEETDES